MPWEVGQGLLLEHMEKCHGVMVDDLPYYLCLKNDFRSLKPSTKLNGRIPLADRLSPTRADGSSDGRRVMNVDDTETTSLLNSRSRPKGRVLFADDILADGS